jgi:hypothetical protein
MEIKIISRDLSFGDGEYLMLVDGKMCHGEVSVSESMSGYILNITTNQEEVNEELDENGSAISSGEILHLKEILRNPDVKIFAENKYVVVDSHLKLIISQIIGTPIYRRIKTSAEEKTVERILSINHGKQKSLPIDDFVFLVSTILEMAEEKEST